MAGEFLDPGLLSQLQARMDREDSLRQQIRDTLQGLEKLQRRIMSEMARTHALPGQDAVELYANIDLLLQEQNSYISQLSRVTDGTPFWKHSSMWSREMQQASFMWMYLTWLRTNKFPTFKEIGVLLDVAVNVENEDAFHLTMEEYLHGLITLTEEVSRLAVNSVTLSDYARPLKIRVLVRTIHAGFQQFNLKNDSLRRRADSIKYNMKKIEEVVYDLSLRGLVKQDQVQDGMA